MDKLTKQLIEALGRAAAAEKIAEKALAMAQEALIKVELLGRQQPTYQYAPQGVENAGDCKEIPDDSGFDEPLELPRISPFSISPNRLRPAKGLEPDEKVSEGGSDDI